MICGWRLESPFLTMISIRGKGALGVHLESWILTSSPWWAQEAREDEERRNCLNSCFARACTSKLCTCKSKPSLGGHPKMATQRALKPQEKRSWRKISRVRGERSNCQTRLHSSRSRDLWTWDHTAEQPSTAVPRPHPTPAPAHLFFLPLLLPGKVRNHSEQAGGGEATRGRETEKGHPLRHRCHLEVLVWGYVFDFK